MEALLTIAGFVALLLWGLRMVRTAVERAYGGELKRLIGRATGNRLAAAGLGAAVTALLQSSTATALMAASFTGRGLMTTAAALAVILGADLGTTVVAQILLVGTGPVAPVVLLIGVALRLRIRHARLRHFGRGIIGLGLILLALSQITATATPLAEGPVWQAVMAAAGDESSLLVLAAALLTWLAHSSLAVVLLSASFAAGGALPLDAAFAVVLGANLGAVLPPLAATAAEPPAARRPPLGNLIFRATGVVATIAFIPGIVALATPLDVSPARQVVTFHMAFNLALVAAFLGLTGVVARLCHAMIPDQALPENEAQPRYLDTTFAAEPARALPLAARETLRLGDMVERMLLATQTIFTHNDLERIRDVRRRDRQIDELAEAIKLYASRVRPRVAGDRDKARLDQILAFALNLEHAADIINTTVMQTAERKLTDKLAFSDEGWAEISALLDQVIANLRLAQAVFTESDVRTARQLLQNKDYLRHLESWASDRHLNRLAEQRSESIETSALHLDLLRDLKRINAHIAALATHILGAAGELAETRLRPAEQAEAPPDDSAEPAEGSPPQEPGGA